MFEEDKFYWKARKESKNKITKVIKVWSEKEASIHDAGFEAGAEFGYNIGYRKAMTIRTEIEQAGKANEWHYPSKGELPNCDEETQLIFYVNCYYEVGGETKIIKRTVLGFYKKSFLNDDVKLFVERSKGYEDEHLPKAVIAWKEIILPELKESK